MATYLCLETSQTACIRLQCLTPNIMQWSTQIWLLDMTTVMSYWTTQAEQKHMPLMSLWHIVLHQAHSSSTQIYQAAIAEHPWKALLLLKMMKVKKIAGLMTLNSVEGLELYWKLSGSLFLKSIQELAIYLNYDRGQRLDLSKIAKQLKRAMMHFQFRTVADMTVLNYLGVRRRYGQLFSEIWNWTCGNEPYHTVPFPWMGWRPQNKVSVCRTLDNVIWEWLQVEPLLCEDLTKLVGYMGRDLDLLVTELSWNLYFENDTQLTIPIVFRTPHNLKSELPYHKTAILQAYYQFTALMQEWMNTITRSTMDVQGIQSYTLCIEASVLQPWISASLFPEFQTVPEEDLALIKLNNQLQCPLQRFKLRDAWVSDDAYELQPIIAAYQKTSSLFKSSLHALSLSRPLFLLTKPYALSCEAKASPQFLECTLQKWWIHPSANKDNRYYKMRDEQQRLVWVTHDAAQGYSVHGFFG